MLAAVKMLGDTAGWYALQAPPPMPNGSALHSSPMIRLLYYLRTASVFYNSGHRRFANAVELMEKVDAAPEATEFEVRPIGEVLRYSVAFVRPLQKMNANDVTDPIFRAHFANVLAIQERRLLDRLPLGYISQVGMPDEGHPVFGIRSEQEADDLAMDSKAYRPEPAVAEWFAFRHRLLYRHMPSEEVANGLHRFFVGTQTQVCAAPLI